MKFDELLNAIKEYHAVVADAVTVSGLVQETYGDQLRSLGVGRVVLLPNGKLVMNVRGHLKAKESGTGIATLFQRFFVVELGWLLEGDTPAEDGHHEQIEAALAAYELEGDGAYVWVVPDGYMASLTSREEQWAQQGGGYFSHESMCVVNTSDIPTRCTLDVYYESDTSLNFSHVFEVNPRQSVHYRLDKMTRPDGEPMIRKDEPVAYRVISHDARVVVQGSRILTSGENSEFASFGTVMAWTPLE